MVAPAGKDAGKDVEQQDGDGDQHRPAPGETDPIVIGAVGELENGKVARLLMTARRRELTRYSALIAIAAVCHGAEGAGKLPTAPALWGPDSYSDGAGMNQIPKMAAFVQHNMPQNQPDSLTPQEAYDVATYIHSKPHVVFNMKDHM